jgi:hypothetical protein
MLASDDPSRPGALRARLWYNIGSNETEATMALLDTLQSVQFVTVKDKRFALIDADDWEALIEWLETLEDLEIAKEAFAELKTANGDRERAGWLKWDDVKEELN